MKSDPQGLSTLRFIAKYADARRNGLSAQEAKELLADQQRHDTATLNDPMENDDDDRITDDE